MSKSDPPKISRTRNWAFIMYPDSAPESWRDLLTGHHVDMLISPLHDADLNATGEEKKPHWHVVLAFSGPKTEKQAQELADSVNGTKVQAVSSMRSYARYLCHLDNPEKAQYEPSQVVVLGGIDYLDMISSAADIDTAISQMEQWCDDNGIFSYAQLCRYARQNRPDWTRLLHHRCTVHMKAYLQSCQWEVDNGVVYGSPSGDPKMAPDSIEEEFAGQGA